MLNDYRDRLNKLNLDILVSIQEPNEAKTVCVNATEVDELLLGTISAISAREQILEVDALSNGDVVAAVRPQGSAGDRKAPSVHLPKLQISKFRGDPMQWAEFWDSYSSTIHDNAELSDIDKFKYLRSFLSDDAFRLIAGYQLTSVNYAAAIEVLRDRFGNKQLAVFAHFEAMLSLSVANYDIKQLQTTYDECEKHIRSLVALGLAEETFEQVFTPIILSKLPPYVKMELHRKNGSNPWELSKLRMWLKEEIRARDYSQRVFANGTTSSDDRNGKRQNFSHQRKQAPSTKQGTTSALVANDEKSTPRCCFCSESHYSDSCTKYSTADARKERALEQRRCFKCLSTKHIAKNCQNPRKCIHCNKLNHHRSICKVKFGSSGAAEKSTALTVEEDYDSDVSQPVQLIAQGERAILQTALAKIKAPDGDNVSARILFDTGCSRSFITTKLSQSIKTCSQPDEVVAIAGFSDTTRKTVKYKTVEFDIVLANGDKKTVTANVTPTISCPIQKFPFDVKSFPVVSQLQLAEPIEKTMKMVTIDILLGTDYYYDFIGSEQVRLTNGMVFLSSSLGFIATGKIQCTKSGPRKGSALLTSRTEAFPESTFHVEKFWSLEDIGIKESATSNDDEDAIQSFKKSIKFNDGRYHVDWPWKSDEKELPDNYHLALGRLKSLKKRIDATPNILEQYDQTIKDQIEKGIVEEVPNKITENKIHYIPHHCVLTPNKTTTKLRIVYDASAKAHKQAYSLNDCLNRGPVLLDDLCGLLLRFRIHPIAIVSDIEKAFLQVGLNESSRDVTRFLWLREPKGGVTASNIIEYRFCRVPFGVNSSMFLLSGTILFHVDNSNNPVAVEVKGNLYVDNVINGKQNLDEAVKYYREAKKFFQEASMNLREWYSNSAELREIFASNDRGKDIITKVLGLQWDTEKDTLSTSSFTIQKESVTTKRQMLSNLAKVFDPCGYFAPLTVTGKILIQTLWKDQYSWDDPLPSSIVQGWLDCASDLMQIAEFKIPRCMFVKKTISTSKLSLHCFTDASSKAYGACVYLVNETKSGNESTLVFEKSRVAPLKELTIPRMELMGVVIGVRLLKFIDEQLQLTIHSKVLWSDSQCVLHWLGKTSVETKFVNNRVTEIRSHQGISYRYVPTENNPADLLSRGCSFDYLTGSKLWWQGPNWLLDVPEKWPRNIVPKRSKEDESCAVESFNMIVLTVNEATDGDKAQPIIDITKFSSLSRLLHVTAWIFRFVGNLKSSRSMKPIEKGNLKATELAHAQKYWEKVTQRKYFDDIFTELTNGTKNGKAHQLSAFVDVEGILRRAGRLDKADIPEDAKVPILLPKNCHFTTLIIADSHSKVYHSSIPHTLAQTRLRYWIIHGRSQVRSVLTKCRLCRLLYGGPFRYPDSPSLPKFRVGTQRPFECVGIDYMGPLQIKQSDRSSENVKKVWICLYTCAVVRAVHLEVVSDLSAHQFLMSLRRFVALFGKPHIIVSDNAKQFRASDRFLNKVLTSQQVQEFAASQGISWKFITERSPWMGGFYERMIGIVKRALKTSLDRKCVNLVELQTLSIEVASIVNSRPIIYADSDTIPLTPAHFVRGPCFKVSSISDASENQIRQSATHVEILSMWKRIQAMMNSFWRTWRHQYLLSLRDTANLKDRNSSHLQPKVNSVVLIKDNLPRSCWRMGKIVELQQSHDGKVRTAIVEMSNHHRISRAIRHLYPIEVPSDVAEIVPQPSYNNDNTDDSVSVASELL